jgi:hypothetical protein
VKQTTQGIEAQTNIWVSSFSRADTLVAPLPVEVNGKSVG